MTPMQITILGLLTTGTCSIVVGAALLLDTLGEYIERRRWRKHLNELLTKGTLR